MKKVIQILLLVSSVSACIESTDSLPQQPPKNMNEEQDFASESKLIDSLYGVDQSIQLKIVEESENGIGENFYALLSEQEEIFERHISELKKIYSRIGYPTIDKVGKESSAHFFTLVQHADADVDFQARMLLEIEGELNEGSVASKDFAFLKDRVSLAQHGYQIFGTQLDYNTNIGQAFPKKIQDSTRVNERRRKLGLNLLEEYLNEVTIIHFEMNKAHYHELGIFEPLLYETESSEGNK